MSLLTDEEIKSVADVIAKLTAGVGVEPIAYLAWRDGKPAWDREYCICEDAVYPTEADTVCSTDPDAPHGFNRHRSLNEDRYVCECDGWVPHNAEITGQAG